MNPALEYHNLQTRRRFFQGAGLKLGGIALAQLAMKKGFAKIDGQAKTGIHTGLPGFPHFVPKAKNLSLIHI